MVGGCELPMTTTASNRLGSESSDSRDGGPECCYVDLSYRGYDVDDIQVFKACQKRGVTRHIRRELERHNAIGPIIGHILGIDYHTATTTLCSWRHTPNVKSACLVEKDSIRNSNVLPSTSTSVSSASTTGPTLLQRACFSNNV